MLPSTIKVVILDDHPLMRAGIRANVETSPAIEIVGEGSAGEHLEPLIRKHRPDVVLLDLQMPQRADELVRDGGPMFQALPSIRTMRARYPETRIVIITQHLLRGYLEQFLEAGVSGYLLKDDVLSTELVSAIRTVRNGGVCLSRRASDELSTRPRGMPQPDHLTERHKEVIAALLKHPDAPLSAIAAQLGITEATLKNHLREIRDRLGVRTTKAALIKAVQLGLAPVDLIVISGLYDDGL